MWRCLLAGLLTAGGLFLLFVSSFDEPASALRTLHSAVAPTRGPATQVATAGTVEPPVAMAGQQSPGAVDAISSLQSGPAVDNEVAPNATSATPARESD